MDVSQPTGLIPNVHNRPNRSIPCGIVLEEGDVVKVCPILIGHNDRAPIKSKNFFGWISTKGCVEELKSIFGC